MPDFDLRPRVVFWTTAGAVVVLVDPATATTGSAVFPVVGAVPYRVEFTPQPAIVLDFPTGPTVLPVDLSGMFAGGGGPGTVEIPGLGMATYEVVFGPPDIAPDQLVSPLSVGGALLGSYWPLLALGAVGLLLLWSRK